MAVVGLIPPVSYVLTFGIALWPIVGGVLMLKDRAAARFAALEGEERRRVRRRVPYAPLPPSEVDRRAPATPRSSPATLVAARRDTAPLTSRAGSRALVSATTCATVRTALPFPWR